MFVLKGQSSVPREMVDSVLLYWHVISVCDGMSHRIVTNERIRSCEKNNSFRRDLRDECAFRPGGVLPLGMEKVVDCVTKHRGHTDPFSMVIFGGTGDLTHRKLAPALYRLMLDGHLHEDTVIVGVARRDWSDAYFEQQLRESVMKSVGQDFDRTVWDRLARHLVYVRGDADQPETYPRVDERLRQIGSRLAGRPDRNRLYYLATLPSLYPVLIESLGELEARRDEGWGRVVVEKPFGHDLASAKALNSLLQRYFDERQIFRIDHYLGKDTVQNILVFRFANGIFEPIWNRHYIDHVQITVAESIGVGHRGAFYEEAGALRDMVQNHLLQLLSLIAMEPPSSFDAHSIRNEKVKVLRSMPIPSMAQVERNTVRGQYIAGVVDGKPVPGYREEPGVDPNSKVETYAALKVGIENWRWAGVPFLLRTGKRMPHRSSEIVVAFKCPPHLAFRRSMVPELRSNHLVIHIQPREGITLSIGAKVPGSEIQIRNVDMEMFYERTFKERSADAYEYLLLEAILGDTTMFIRGDEAESAWSFIEAIRQGWDEDVVPLATYPAGSWGPTEASKLLNWSSTIKPIEVADPDDPWSRQLGLCAVPSERGDR